MPESDEELRSRFVLHIKRTVSADHIVSVDSVDYEIPRGHAGEKLLVHRRLLDNTLSVLHDGRLVDIHPVDLHANARARRARAPKRDQRYP